MGIAAGVALAAALPELPYACGLATTAMFARDVTASPMTPVGGRIAVRRAVPDSELLTAARVDAATDRRWRQRLAACTALLDRAGR